MISSGLAWGSGSTSLLMISSGLTWGSSSTSLLMISSGLTWGSSSTSLLLIFWSRLEPLSCVRRGRVSKKRLISFELSATHLLPCEHRWKSVRKLTVFRDLWRNQIWQWLEEGCRKSMLGVWIELFPQRLYFRGVGLNNKLMLKKGLICFHVGCVWVIELN